MDLNRLYFDHQVTLMQAARSPTCALRQDHAMRASRIAGRIGNTQRALGARAASAWEFLALPTPAGVKTADPAAADCGCEAGMKDRA